MTTAKNARDNHLEMAAYYSPARLSVKKTAPRPRLPKSPRNLFPLILSLSKDARYGG